MNCDIIKDLIPLSEEGLCSEESDRLIAEHIKTCETCRMLYEETPQTTVNTSPMPDKEETFKKVNRKIKRMTWKTWIIGGILLVILAALGFLTFGQITKKQGFVSFETIIQSFEARKIAGYIADKDFDAYVNSISDIYSGDIFQLRSIEKIKENDKLLLAEAYEKSYGNSKVKDIDVSSVYEQMLSEDSYTISNKVKIKFEDGQILNIDLSKSTDGKYISDVYTGRIDECSFFESALQFSNWHEIYPVGIIEILMPKDDISSGITSRRFAEQYREAYINSKTNFLEAGFTADNLFISRPRYDEDKKMLYYNINIEANDSSGSAVMITRLYYDYKGLIPPEKSTVKVYTNGCTPELEEALINFFG